MTKKLSIIAICLAYSATASAAWVGTLPDQDDEQQTVGVEHEIEKEPHASSPNARDQNAGLSWLERLTPQQPVQPVYAVDDPNALFR